MVRSYAVSSSEFGPLGSQAQRWPGFSVLRWRLDQLLLDAARDEFAVSSRKIMQGMSRRFWFTHRERAADLSEAVSCRLPSLRMWPVRGGGGEGARRFMENARHAPQATSDS